MTDKIEFDKIKCVIFDFDGVILDSSKVKTECFKKLYRSYEGIYDDAMKYHFENKGMSRYKQFDYVSKNMMKSKNPEALAKEMAEKFADIVFNEVSKAAFINGSIELIQFLSQFMPLYIISSAPNNELEKIIKYRKLEKYFKNYFGSVDYKDKYIKKIEIEEKLDSHEIIYIGDTIRDLEAARKAEVHFYGVKNDLVDFSQQNCMLCSDLKEIKNKFQNIQK